MTVNFKTTPLISDKKPYSRWVEEVKAWTELTPITPDKQDLAIALSLPEDDSISIRDKVFNELSLENLKKQDGVKTLITFMDNLFKKMPYQKLMNHILNLIDFQEHLK